MGNLMIGKTYQSGIANLTVGKNLFQMNSSANFINDPLKLKQILVEQGYLYIPHFYSSQEISIVKEEIANNLFSRGLLNQDKLPLSFEPSAASLDKLTFKQEDVKNLPNYLKLMESKKILSFMKLLLDEDVFTYPFKWLRAMNKGASSGIHYDIVYMGRGTDQLLSCWTALDDTPPEKGGLLMGTKFKDISTLKNTYGKVDIDRDHLKGGWYTDDPLEINQKYGGEWHTSHFNEGDIVIFGMYQLHGSLRNETNQLRITCDTRYQRASEPRDERWANKDAILHNSDGKNILEIGDFKKVWAETR